MEHSSHRNHPGRRSHDVHKTEGIDADADLRARLIDEQAVAYPQSDELARLYYLSCEPDLLLAAFERRHPMKAFFRRHPSLAHGLVLLALAAATLATFIAASLSRRW